MKPSAAVSAASRASSASSERAHCQHLAGATPSYCVIRVLTHHASLVPTKVLLYDRPAFHRRGVAFALCIWGAALRGGQRAAGAVAAFERQAGLLVLVLVAWLGVAWSGLAV